jgi:hypothetical protein
MLELDLPPQRVSNELALSLALSAREHLRLAHQPEGNRHD